MSSSVRPPQPPAPSAQPAAVEGGPQKARVRGESNVPAPAPSIAPSPNTTTCMLLIGDRVVLRANAPPEAEYILFEIGDIELRSSEPGRVREHGYQTTVERARARLAQAGVTMELARECAAAMSPVLATAYARGAAARHVARHLGPLEMFQADHYDATAHAYRGVFVDLVALATDLDMPGAGVALQALFLTALLESEADETTVFLSTDAWTKQRKPGERTHRRPSCAAIADLKSSLGDLAGVDPRPVIHDQLPRADVLAFVRAQAATATDAKQQALYAALERAVTVREMPDRGPLAEPELWAIETRLEAGELEGTLEAVEEVERTRGRTPGTTYLRARTSLALRLEPPKLIAERVSALALSMTSFQELSLLAAEAWLEAGDPRRAMPYARDLADAPGIDDGLLLRARRLLARALGAAPDKLKTFADSMPVAPMPASQRPGPAAAPSLPPVSVPDPNAPTSWPPQRSRVPTARPITQAPQAPAASQAPQASVAPQVPSLEIPVPEIAATPNVPMVPPAAPSKPPPLPKRAKPTSPPAARGSSVPPPAQELSAPPPPPVPASPISPLATTASPSMSAGPRPAQAEPLSSLPPALRQRPERSDMPSSPPPPLDIELPPPADLAASFTLELPGPEAAPPKVSTPAPSVVPADTGAGASQRPIRRRSINMGVVQMETRAPPAFDPRAEPDGDDPPRPVAPPRTASGRHPITQDDPGKAAAAARDDDDELGIKDTMKGKDLEARRAARLSSVPPPPRVPSDEQDAHARPTPLRPPNPSPLPPMRPPMPTPVLDSDLPPSSTEERARALEKEKSIRRSGSGRSPSAEIAMRGASLPPFRLENPPPLLAKAPLLPKLGGADELAEHLPLPPGLAAEPRSLDQLPQSVLEARVAFTMLARELGLDYRLKRGVELRADVSGIEAMQSVLLESFPDHSLRTGEDAYELRRHGALLSEILARRLDAEWIDISPSELGYWSMIIPPDTRVWPFGRVARLVELGHKERDLVSYFFELQSRARGR